MYEQGLAGPPKDVAKGARLGRSLMGSVLVLRA
jgi:hypothetical protein